jgi:hypothetical protein
VQLRLVARLRTDDAGMTGSATGIGLVLAAALAVAAGLSLPPAAAGAGGGRGAVSAPPAALGLDPFYAKHLDAGGIPVVGSARVPDEALTIAREIVVALLARRPDIRAELVRRQVRIAVMAQEESTTDLPEQRHWKKPAPDDRRLTICEKKTFERIAAMSDREYWDMRARGTGGTLTSVGAENLLAVPGSRYFGETILVHEFSHAIFSAIERVDPALHAEVARAYEAARAARRWDRDYAATSLQEYWAEGTQFWFNSNMLARLDDGEILSDRDLKRYDPALFAALRQVYGKRHRIAADPFYRHEARLNVPEGYRSADC